MASVPTLITGASGALGSLVHARLAERGLDALAGSRDPAAFGAAGRRLDFDDPATLDLHGVGTLVLISAGYAEDDVVVARHGRVIAAAEEHGVRHVVYTSLTGAGDQLGMALAHRWTERRLAASPILATILRNGLYAELLGELCTPVDGAVRTPLGEGALAAVAREDLADVTAAVAADPAPHADRTYELVGTEGVSGADVAADLAVPYAPMTLGETRATLTSPPLLPFQPPMLLSIFSAVAHGFLGGTDGDLRDLLGREPRPARRIAASAARPSAAPLR